MEFYKALFTAVVGGISVYYFPKWIKGLCNYFRPILVYQFSDNKPDTMPGIRHSFGQFVKDEEALSKKAWEHTSGGSGGGDATCFGPYTKEIPFRGRYKARFRIKICGIKDQNTDIIKLDVAYGSREGVGIPIVEKILKGKNLNDGKYKDFDVKFEYDGQSLIEFRCFVINPRRYNVDRIIFDNVKIFMIADFV
ncbi:MAG TPA: hypothetical protein VMD04_04045 [Candidatus Margulisiibacteriota bacterium]|nr:hypothetical protein [Candidatus Margulisiibacteriota bacterium]